MIPRNKSQRYLTLFWTLFRAGQYIQLQGRVRQAGTHTRVCNYSWCLNLDHSLHELDAAYTHTGDSGIPSFQNVGFDRGHSFPCLRVMRIIDAKQGRHVRLYPSRGIPCASCMPMLMSLKFPRQAWRLYRSCAGISRTCV